MKGTFHSKNLTEHYIERVLKPHLLKNQIKKALIVLDQARCHLTAEFKNSLNNAGFELIFIPTGLTGIIYIVN